ncbi:MAG: 30S ribosome-binding factor RbfA [Steroidobacteraceae bacterium]
MADSRRRKIEAELQRALAELVGREVKDPRVGNVTITAVDVAPDLSTARVFFIPFASHHDADEVRVGLTRAGGFLRGQVGRRLGLRHTPRLEFVFDDSFDRAQRLSSLIDGAAGAGRKPG